MSKVVRIFTAGVAAFLAVLIFAAALLMSHITSFYDETATSKKDCIVVFGAAVAPGAKPSRALYDRTMSAAELYESRLSDCVILSGAPSVYGAHEVDVMRDIMIANGARLADINFDFDGTNTIQTINNLDKDRSYVFVSNDFHLARINLLAKRAGIKDFSLHASHYNKGRPKKETYWLLREMVAVIYYFFGTI